MNSKIYIGPVAGKVVYYDKKTKEALISKKSILLSDEEPKKGHISKVVLLMAVLFGLGALFKFVPLKVAFSGTWTKETLIYLFFIWLVTSIVLICITHRALYENIEETELAIKTSFEQALKIMSFGIN